MKILCMFTEQLIVLTFGMKKLDYNNNMCLTSHTSIKKEILFYQASKPTERFSIHSWRITWVQIKEI
jgi:hypothetical protein